jgi:hypothetical protein
MGFNFCGEASGAKRVMSLYLANCVVPEEFRKFQWPGRFEVLPRVGEHISACGHSEVVLEITRIVHVGSPDDRPSPKIELHCEKPKDLLLD